MYLHSQEEVEDLKLHILGYINLLLERKNLNNLTLYNTYMGVTSSYLTRSVANLFNMADVYLLFHIDLCAQWKPADHT